MGRQRERAQRVEGRALLMKIPRSHSFHTHHIILIAPPTTHTHTHTYIKNAALSGRHLLDADAASRTARCGLCLVCLQPCLSAPSEQRKSNAPPTHGRFNVKIAAGIRVCVWCVLLQYWVVWGGGSGLSTISLS